MAEITRDYSIDLLGRKMKTEEAWRDRVRDGLSEEAGRVSCTAQVGHERGVGRHVIETEEFDMRATVLNRTMRIAKEGEHVVKECVVLIQNGRARRWD